jgi:hypothetical protein
VARAESITRWPCTLLALRCLPLCAETVRLCPEVLAEWERAAKAGVTAKVAMSNIAWPARTESMQKTSRGDEAVLVCKLITVLGECNPPEGEIELFFGAGNRYSRRARSPKQMNQKLLRPVVTF